MKKVKNITFAAISAAMLFTGCIKEADPYSVATEEQVTLETLIQGIPASLVQAGSTGYGSQGAAWDFALPAIHLATESMSGDLVVSGNVGYDWFSQWGTNDALGADYAVGALTWDNYYSWIMAANNVIKHIGDTDVNSLPAKEKSFLGFAYTYRAMFYLDLVRLYEFKENKYTSAPDVLGLGVPIVLPETTEVMAKNNPRAKVEDIYNKVIFPDLEKAADLLASYTPDNKYALSSAVVYGLQARAWLERATVTDSAEEYAKAAECARQAITASGCTPLTQAEWEDPANGFNNANANNSWIWGLALPSESTSNLLCFTAHMSTENAWSAYGNDACRAINRNLFNSIQNNDFRKHSWLDPERKNPEAQSYSYKSCRPEGMVYLNKLPDYANIKFRPAQGNFNESKVGGAADHPMMRVEEMYFIEAEAKAHANLSEGVRLLNEFMNNYRMIDGGKYDCSNMATTIETFTNELILQKRIEFWGEGIIMFDLKRLNVSTKRGYVGTNAAGSYRLNADGRAPYWNFVITNGEAQNNPIIDTQNNPDPSQSIKPWNG